MACKFLASHPCSIKGMGVEAMTCHSNTPSIAPPLFHGAIIVERCSTLHARTVRLPRTKSRKQVAGLLQTPPTNGSVDLFFQFSPWRDTGTEGVRGGTPPGFNSRRADGIV